MFTGIIQGTGIVAAIQKKADWVIDIQTRLPLADLVLGASVACNGICLTVINFNADSFRVQLSKETLTMTTAQNWAVGQKLNLERALRAGDELGGHYVSGHVDGVATVVDRGDEGDSLRMVFDAPENLAAFIAAKGSVTLDGVSLTVNSVQGKQFGVNIIPHTQSVTTLGVLKSGDKVNIEIDMLARYVARSLQYAKG